jgi:lysophospholipase L1-like esterase
MCHRSPNSYPQVLTQRKQDLHLTFAACSGAWMRHVRNTEQYDGVEGSCRRGGCGPGRQTGGDTPGGQISTFASSGANLATVTIGGNDANFAGVLAYCVSPLHKRCDLDLDPKETQLIESLYTPLYDTYRQVRDAAGYGQVLVLGYPVIFQTEVDCGGTYELQPEERVWLAQRFSQMDDVIERAVGAANAANDKGMDAFIEYLDMEDAFHGHEICRNDADGRSYANGIDAGIPEAFHPNEKGHAALAAYILDHLVTGKAVDPCPDC